MQPDLLGNVARAYRDRVWHEAERERLATEIPRASCRPLRARLARRLHALANRLEPRPTETGPAPPILVR